MMDRLVNACHTMCYGGLPVAVAIGSPLALLRQACELRLRLIRHGSGFKQQRLAR